MKSKRSAPNHGDAIQSQQHIRETLPDKLSPKAQAIPDRINTRAKEQAASPEGKARRKRANEALAKGGFKGRADFIGIMLGARGYE